VRILVVEDEADAREMLEVGLGHYGAEVRATATAAAALDELRRWPPQVLVADIGMAGEDGYALIHEVRALGPDSGGQVLAIALTAYVTAGDKRKAIAAGFDLHWPKPVDLPALAAGIGDLLTRGDVSRSAISSGLARSQ
jgi:CheY-like chemotaxis protein